MLMATPIRISAAATPAGRMKRLRLRPRRALRLPPVPFAPSFPGGATSSATGAVVAGRSRMSVLICLPQLSGETLGHAFEDAPHVCGECPGIFTTHFVLAHEAARQDGA